MAVVNIDTAELGSFRHIAGTISIDHYELTFEDGFIVLDIDELRALKEAINAVAIPAS